MTPLTKKQIYIISSLIGVLVLIILSLIFLYTRDSGEQQEIVLENTPEIEFCEEYFQLSEDSITSCMIMDDVMLTHYPDEKIEIKRVSSDTVLNQFVCGLGEGFYFECDSFLSLLYVVDINKDGFRDLGVHTFTNIPVIGFTFYTYDGTNDTYTVQKGLESVINPKIIDDETIEGGFNEITIDTSYSSYNLFKLQEDGSYKEMKSCTTAVDRVDGTSTVTCDGLEGVYEYFGGVQRSFVFNINKTKENEYTVIGTRQRLSPMMDDGTRFIMEEDLTGHITLTDYNKGTLTINEYVECTTNFTFNNEDGTSIVFEETPSSRCSLFDGVELFKIE